LKSLKEKYAILVQAWRTGDSKKLISDRNRNWLPMICAFGKTPQREFVLVGVAHLAGPDRIIEALKKKGYLIGKM
jgi:uncharacterized protein YbaP (TraB family)